MIRTCQKIKLTIALLAVFMLKGMPLFAQENAFKYKAAVQKIDSAGVYKIELSPDIIAKSNEALNDIRLMDSTGGFVAYALSSNIAVEKQDNFVVFPGMDAGTDTATVYIAENSNKISIDELWLKLKNTEVSRTVNIAGSDDLKQWFAIKEDIDLQDAGSAGGPDYEQSLNFPISNYRYFKIQVYGKNKTPVKILQAGIYTENLNKPQFTALPTVKFNISDTNKISRVYIHLDEPYRVNKLHLLITGPKYYSRRVVVYSGDQNLDEINANQLCDTVISSAGTQEILLSAKNTLLRVDIYNGDDNPLHIGSIDAYGLKQYAVSYLESGHNYYILSGDSAAKQVNYDLSFLKYRAFNLLPVISHAAVNKNTAYFAETGIVKHNFTPLLWAAIVLVLLLLSFLTLKMLREIKPKA